MGDYKHKFLIAHKISTLIYFNFFVSSQVLQVCLFYGKKESSVHSQSPLKAMSKNAANENISAIPNRDTSHLKRCAPPISIYSPYAEVSKNLLFKALNRSHQSLSESCHFTVKILLNLWIFIIILLFSFRFFPFVYFFFPILNSFVWSNNANYVAIVRHLMC